MATSPSITIDYISPARITDTGSTITFGAIQWSITGQSESDFAATKANYLADTSSWSNRYYWDSTGGINSFDGLSNSVTITSSPITVYTKSIVKSSSGTFVTAYTNESDAQSACNGVSGAASYVYEYSIGLAPDNSGYSGYGYCVYRYDLSISTSSSSQTYSTTVDVSSYINVESTGGSSGGDTGGGDDGGDTPSTPIITSKVYIGIDGVARRINKMYVGVNGVARKVKKAYIGVDGVAKLVFSAE